MTTVKTMMDMDALKILAEVSGKAAATQVSAQLSDDLKKHVREVIAEHEKRMEHKIKDYFGKHSPEEHLVQHARIDRFLNLMDRVGDNFLGALIRNVMTATLFLLVVGWLAWNKFKGF